ncbi:hypothetical protein F5Y03DRAFT_403222 [Xylaria venustula]|nr:hypothetical protein F5Y03DRAFT_403222 [Xylaria venustula]
MLAAERPAATTLFLTCAVLFSAHLARGLVVGTAAVGALATKRIATACKSHSHTREEPLSIPLDVTRLTVSFFHNAHVAPYAIRVAAAIHAKSNKHVLRDFRSIIRVAKYEAALATKPSSNLVSAWASSDEQKKEVGIVFLSPVNILASQAMPIGAPVPLEEVDDGLSGGLAGHTADDEGDDEMTPLPLDEGDTQWKRNTHMSRWGMKR